MHYKTRATGEQPTEINIEYFDRRLTF